jgi:membrane protease YdiL (CAAX protease family)
MNALFLRKIRTVIWKTVLFLILWGLVQAPLLIPFMNFFKKLFPPEWSRLIIEIIPFISIVFACLLMTRYAEKRNFSTLGFQTGRMINNISIGFLIGLFWIAISLVFQYISGTIFIGAQNAIPAGVFIIYGIALLINASVQEILFRSYIYQTIESNFNALSAIIITSVLFSVSHIGAVKAGFIPTLNVFGAGLVFAVAYHKTKNLWMPIAMHFVWNFSVSSILYKPITDYNGLELFRLKGSSLLAGGEDGVQTTILTTLSIIIVIIPELLIIKPQEKNNEAC